MSKNYNFKTLLEDGFENVSQHFYDENVKVNAQFKANSGIKAIIKRVLVGENCPWCESLAGVYEYGKEPRDVFRRHLRCDCIVTHETEKVATHVWTKEKFDIERIDRIEESKSLSDYLRKKEVVAIEGVNGKKYETSVYVSRKDSRIKLQSLSVNARKTEKYFLENPTPYNEIRIYNDTNIFKIAGYSKKDNFLALNEGLIDPKIFKKLVDDDFVAKNFVEVLNHENNHFLHQKAIENYAKIFDLPIDKAKEELEKNFINYLNSALEYDINFISNNISKYANFGYRQEENKLNEIIADGKLLMNKGELSNEKLAEFINDILKYA